MPIFSKPSGAAAAWEPRQASARLAVTAGADPNGVFTSDLSVSEYALLGEAGFELLHIGRLARARTQKRPELVLLDRRF